RLKHNRPASSLRSWLNLKRAGNDDSGVKTDPNGESIFPTGKHLLHSKSGRARQKCMPFVRLRRAEYGHNAVAQEMHNQTVEPLRGIGHQLERWPQSADGILWVQTCNDLRRANNIGE